MKFRIFKYCLLLSLVVCGCRDKSEVNSETESTSFEEIIASDSFYTENKFDDYSDLLYPNSAKESEFELKILSGDSLWIIRSFSKDIFIIRGYTHSDGYKLVLYDSSSVWDYLGDTLMDVNFDESLDYVINYYSGTGCCPRHENKIFLNRQNSLLFSSKVNILNAYYSEESKTVVTMDYGWQGLNKPMIGICLNRYQWKEDSLIDIETICLRDSNSFWITNTITGEENVIFKLPEDYKKIPSVSWFIKF